MRRPAARLLRSLLPALLLALLAAAGLWAGDGPTIPELRRALLEARSDERVGFALDRLQARIGAPEFPDAGAFGDWLAQLPDGRAAHPVVRLRRGWAYVTARRGAQAVELLEGALRDDPGSGFVRACLGEALRQAGRLAPAMEMLASARRTGYAAPHLRQSLEECFHGLRAGGAVKDAPGLPDYAAGAQAWLAHGPDPALQALLARALLDDLSAYDAPTRERGRLWARTAAPHALAAPADEPAQRVSAAQMALDAALALEGEEAAQPGRTLRFDLLARAYALGTPLEREGHDLPEVLPLLAEAAIDEGRPELAARLARQRLDLSESPAARRVLLRLPPDLGD